MMFTPQVWYFTKYLFIRVSLSSQPPCGGRELSLLLLVDVEAELHARGAGDIDVPFGRSEYHRLAALRLGSLHVQLDLDREDVCFHRALDVFHFAALLGLTTV